MDTGVSRDDDLAESRPRLWSRRRLLRRAALLGLMTPTASSLLAACGGDDDDETPATTGGASTETAAEATNEQATPTTTTAEATATKSAGRGGNIVFNDTTGDSGIDNPIITGAHELTTFFVSEPLVFFDDTATLQPFLAESWEFSDDALELTLTLRQGVTWHDGAPFSANDVLFTLDTIKLETTDTVLRSRLQVGGEYVNWESDDDQTVTLRISEPFAPIMFNLNYVRIIPAHLLADVPDINTDAFNRAPIGTGPWQVADWQQDQFVRYERFDGYWNGPALADELTVVFHADKEVGAAALENGEIDVMAAPPFIQPRFEDREGFTVHPYVYYTPITLAFHHRHPLLQDITVRRAIQLAIDKQAIVETVTRGRGSVAHHQFADTGTLDQYNDPTNVEPVVFDVDEANRLLDEAGYQRGANGIRASLDGQSFAFNLMTYSGTDEYSDSQVLLQAMLREIGIDITLQSVSYSTLMTMCADPNDDPENRALQLEEWPHPFEFDPDVFGELHSSNLPPGGNYMYFEDAEVDRLITEGRETTDLDARLQIYRQLDQRRAETLPSIPLYNAVDAWVTSDRLKGVEQSPYFRWYYRYATPTWWKEE